MSVDLAALLPDSARLAGTSLTVGGCSVEELARQYGTPLYIYDQATLRAAAAHTYEIFEPFGARVSYAAKACSIVAVLQIIRDEGLDLDTVSGGEIGAGLRAGFTPSQLHLHGNFKSDEELERAVALGLRAIVVDNFDELVRLNAVCRRRGATVPIMFRLALPIEVETHPYLRTSGGRTKFGTAFDSPEMNDMLGAVKETSFRLIGLHAHVGSQVTEVDIYSRAAAGLVRSARALTAQGFPIEEVSIGGGWAVPYRPGDPHLLPEAIAAAIKQHVSPDSGLRTAVEPGRAVVARAAVAVYRVGSVKRAGSHHRIIAVDGGMGDNPRPALYDARYTAFPLCRAAGKPEEGTADIAGRYCESGDILAKNLRLPAVAPGDLVCMPVAGAYQLAMASGYNLVPPPAAVMVNGGTSRLIRRRATVDQLLSCDV